MSGEISTRQDVVREILGPMVTLTRAATWDGSGEPYELAMRLARIKQFARQLILMCFSSY